LLFSRRLCRIPKVSKYLKSWEKSGKFGKIWNLEKGLESWGKSGNLAKIPKVSP